MLILKVPLAKMNTAFVIKYFIKKDIFISLIRNKPLKNLIYKLTI